MSNPTTPYCRASADGDTVELFAVPISSTEMQYHVFTTGDTPGGTFPRFSTAAGKYAQALADFGTDPSCMAEEMEALIHWHAELTA